MFIMIMSVGSRQDALCFSVALHEKFNFIHHSNPALVLIAIFPLFGKDVKRLLGYT